MLKEPSRERRSAPGTIHGDQTEVLGMADHGLDQEELLAIRKAVSGGSSTTLTGNEVKSVLKPELEAFHFSIEKY